MELAEKTQSRENTGIWPGSVQSDGKPVYAPTSAIAENRTRILPRSEFGLHQHLKRVGNVDYPMHSLVHGKTLMKKSTAAALLSAFVFPGAGHLYLKKYIPGIVLIGALLVAVYYVITKSIESALQIVDKIQTGDVPLDAAAITELVSKQSAGTDSQLIKFATLAILICWVFGIIDSYRVGRMRDKSE